MVWFRDMRVLVGIQWTLSWVSVRGVFVAEVLFRVDLVADYLCSFQRWFTSFQGLWFSLNDCRGRRLLFDLLRGLPAVYLRLHLLKIAQIMIFFHNWKIRDLLGQSICEATRRLGRGEGSLSWSGFLGLLGTLSQHKTCLGEGWKVSPGASTGLDA